MNLSFNTQPPEGGWLRHKAYVYIVCCFNTQPPEGGWILLICIGMAFAHVSTHSRPKAAGFNL